MKLVRFIGNQKEYYGILKGDNISPFEGNETEFNKLNINEVRLLAPVIPSKIVLVGLNYRDHAAELGMAIPENPIIFLKPSTAIIGPGEDIQYPQGTDRVDYEAELAVVIKDKIRGVSREEALHHVLGYTCFNDVTARDIQEKDMQWTRAKSFDTFAPIGPWIETELDSEDLFIRSYVNGKIKQDSRTSDFIFGVPELIEFISGVMTLFPGDIVSTGTPPNVGPINPGDKVVIEIEGIGKLENFVKAEK